MKEEEEDEEERWKRKKKDEEKEEREKEERESIQHSLLHEKGIFNNYSEGFRLFVERTEYLAAQADDSHADPVIDYRIKSRI
jgi:hypothetical protein